MIKVYAMTCGWMTMSLTSLLRHESGMIKIPVPCYLIVHPKGKVLFDTGLHSDMISSPCERLGVLAPFFEIHYEESEDLAARLAQLDLSVDDIDFVINSHLHFDHCGGNAAIPNSPVILQKAELEVAKSEVAEQIGLFKQDWDLGHDLIAVDGEHDVFGDKTVVCIPTHGHTPGHQSLVIRLDGREIVLAGDACYFKRTLDELHLPKSVFDEKKSLNSLEVLAEFQRRGATIYYGHDPAFWENVPQAPVAL
ncbi:MAG: N-acyl homoserine lactonase family protein [Pseudomonadales bacterium]